MSFFPNWQIRKTWSYWAGVEDTLGLDIGNSTYLISPNSFSIACVTLSTYDMKKKKLDSRSIPTEAATSIALWKRCS